MFLMPEEPTGTAKELMAKGLAPHYFKGESSESLHWEYPERPSSSINTWPPAAVLIAVLVFILLVIWGPPW